MLFNINSRSLVFVWIGLWSTLIAIVATSTSGCASTTPVVVEYVPVVTVRTVYVREAPRELPVVQSETIVQPREASDLDSLIDAARCYDRAEGEGPCHHRPASDLDSLIDAARHYDQPR
jgi:hypothetical protein